MIVEDAILLQGAERFGVDPGSFVSLGGTDGAVYRCRVGSRAYVMKFIPMEQQSEAVYLEKVAFVSYLADHDVPIASPVESISGKRVESVEGGEKGYLVTLTQLADGRHPQPRNLYDWNERLFQVWGQVIGRMHALAKTYPCWERTPETEIEGWQEEFQFFINWCDDPPVKAKWMELYPHLAELPRDRSNYGLTHNDLHQNNFFYNPDARGVHPITIIDFDVCAYHWFITDIAVAVYHAATNGSTTKITERRERTYSFLKPFLRGYHQENQLENCWLEQLPLFMKYREILLYIALTNSWSEDERQKPWIRRWLAEKRARTLRDEPII